MELPNIDPALLAKPLNELALPKEEGMDGMHIANPDGLQGKDTPVATDATPASDDEGKVSYRRFKKFHDEAKEARQEAEYWRQQALQTQHPEPQNYYQAPPPASIQPVYEGADWENFKSLFAGANEDAVKTAYRQELQRIAAVEERAYQRASQAFDQRSQSERQAFRVNREYLDEWTDDAADLLGRDLTDDEQVQLLDIMEEYSAKDTDGMIVAPMNPDQALRIYNMQNASAHSERRAARAAIAKTSSSGSSSDTSVATTPQQDNHQFNAQLGWRTNFRRLTGRDPS